MKRYLGLFLFCLSSNLFAAETAVMMLQGVVEPKTRIEIRYHRNIPTPVLKANFKNQFQLPRLNVKKHEKNQHYLVSVTQP